LDEITAPDHGTALIIKETTKMPAAMFFDSPPDADR